MEVYKQIIIVVRNLSRATNSSDAVTGKMCLCARSIKREVQLVHRLVGPQSQEEGH